MKRKFGMLRESGRCGLVGGLIVSTLSGGCSSGLGRIDRATEKEIGQRVSALGGGATEPRAFTGGETGDRSGWYERRPGTVNPRVEELGFDPASEARDVAALLNRYADDATGMTAEQGAMVLDLDTVFRLADSSSREHRQAEEEFILTVVSYLAEAHLWGPRLFNDTTLGVAGQGDDGSFDSALSVINSLRVSQRLPYGGEVEARWVTRAAQDLVSQSTKEYTSSSELIFNASVPLLRGAGMTAREDLIQADRETVYAARAYERFRRSLLVSIAADYFDLLQTRARIGNQQRQLDSQIQRQKETAAKVVAGRLNPFQNDIVANAVKQSEAQLANLRETYILQLERFKVRLGLDPQKPVVLGELGETLREPTVTPEEAVRRALAYRLDLQNRRDRLTDTERAVGNARNGLLPDLDLQASVSIPTDSAADQAGLSINGGESVYSVGATFSLPLDRKLERLTLRQAQVRLEQDRRSYEEFRDTVVIDARRTVRAIDLARFQLQLAETQITINRRGLQDLSLRDDADPQSVLDRQNALLDAENARDQAVTDLRNAVLAYLLTTGQLRVRPDGTFEAPDGMVIRGVEQGMGDVLPYPEPGDASDAADPVEAGGDAGAP